MDQLLTPHLQVSALRALAYSWQDIEYDYKRLTDAEKAVLTEQQFIGLLRAMLDCGIVMWPK